MMMMITGVSASMVLGAVSVFSWIIAEVPQIITNHKQKSADGLSLAFLITWIFGDLFNLFGCMLEPATLPTQMYVAMIYLATTTILTTQAVYYDRIRSRSEKVIKAGVMEKEREHHNGCDTEHVNDAGKYALPSSSPIPLPPYPNKSSHEELFFMSARSLSVSHTPPIVSSMYQTPTLDVEEYSLSEPLLSEVKAPRSSSEPQIKTTLCVVFSMILFLGGCQRQLEDNSRNFKHPGGGVVFQVGRRLLRTEVYPRDQGNIIFNGEKLVDESSGIGSFLGWGMAVIYLGGRLPQIFLNFKRGTSEGLNPLMFVFAILGNGTYIASILANSLEWSILKPNLPWLVDAGGCMLLDTFIIIQFLYFRWRKATQEEKLTT